jgi:hypothetical protein
MRNKSCPIVTFQTERKGGFELIAAGAIEIDASGVGRMLPAGRPRLQYGKPQVNTLPLGSAMRDRSRFWAAGEKLSRPRVQTAAFLQQVPMTIELGSSLAWKCGVLLVT